MTDLCIYAQRDFLGIYVISSIYWCMWLLNTESLNDGNFWNMPCHENTSSVLTWNIQELFSFRSMVSCSNYYAEHSFRNISKKRILNRILWKRELEQCRILEMSVSTFMIFRKTVLYVRHILAFLAKNWSSNTNIPKLTSALVINGTCLYRLIYICPGI